MLDEVSLKIGTRFNFLVDVPQGFDDHVNISISDVTELLKKAMEKASR